MRLDIDASTTVGVGDGTRVLGEFNQMIANSCFTYLGAHSPEWRPSLRQSGDWRSLRSEGFDAPDEAEGPGFLGGKAGVPDGENLRALIDALETFLGFGDRFNGRDPELFGRKRVENNADALPAVFHAEDGSGKRPAETKILVASRCFKEAIGLSRCEQIHNRLDAQGDGLFERLLQLHNNLVDHFATIGNRTEGEFLGEEQFGARCVARAEESQSVGAKKLDVMCVRIFDGVAATSKTRIFV